MKHLATKAIILRRIDYGEADRIITFLTSDYGKIRAIAKGVRKQKSKLAGGIELFSISEIHFINGRGDIDTLVSTRLIRHYGTIVKNLDRTELAYRFLKVVDKTVEDKTGTDYFDILDESLAALDSPKIPEHLVEISFSMRMLQLLGHVPQFTVDSSGKPLDQNAQYEFDYESVSFKENPEGQFNKNHLKVLKLLAHNPPQAMSLVQGISGYIEQLAPLVRSLFVQYVPQ